MNRSDRLYFHDPCEIDKRLHRLASAASFLSQARHDQAEIVRLHRRAIENESLIRSLKDAVTMLQSVIRDLTYEK
jgi:hypothetical protein